MKFVLMGYWELETPCFEKYVDSYNSAMFLANQVFVNHL